METIRNVTSPSDIVHHSKSHIVIILLLMIFMVSYSIGQPAVNGNTTIVFGGTGHVISGQLQSDVVIGDPFVGTIQAGNGTISGDVGQWSFYNLAPQVPVVSASDGDYTLQVYVTWSLDVLSPPTTGQTQVFRDDQTNANIVAPGIEYYEDTNNLNPGEFYNYSIILSNYYAESATGSDVGFINPNGKILGN